ncbi:hypothetical protein [Actinoplanes sp. NPDC026619]|uniref:hypothetical protein n=1 Tax=Actinoplanes sp. NPDC026619 TaxID=3155798 RepID=UPI0033D6FEDC
MTAVARVLPRNWDGHRLLRFIAGLAMLALAFTTPALAEPAAPIPVAAIPVTAIPVAAVPVTSVAVGETVAETSVAETSVAVSEPAPVLPAVRIWAATRPAEILVILALEALVVLIGATARTRGQRAPPAI